MKRFFYFLMLFFSFAFFSCMTLQKDLAIDVDETEYQGSMLELELRIAHLDVLAITGNTESGFAVEKNAILKTIDESLASPVIDKSVEARFLALRGRTFLIYGDRVSAKKMLREAEKKSMNDTQVLILKRRVGELSIVSEVSENPSLKSGLLFLESAVEHYEKNDYAESAGMFDVAFTLLDPAYKAEYGIIRDKAWLLKDSDSSDVDTLSFMEKTSVTVSDMLCITQKAKGNVLVSVTGGKKLKAKPLFRMMSEKKLLESVSGHDDGKISADTAVTKKLCARFLWNVYSLNHAELDRNMYSKKYASRANPKSPIRDLDISDADFDAVVGTVENEIMELSDGVNFSPDKNVSGKEFYDSLMSGEL